MRKFKRYFRQYKEQIIHGIVILISVCLMIFVLYPLIQQVRQRMEKIGEIRREVAGLEQKGQYLESLDAQTLDTQYADLLSAVPSEKTVPSVISTIENLISQENIVLSEMRIQNPGAIATSAAIQLSAQEQKIGGKILALDISLDGQIEQIRNVLEQAVRVRRFIRIDKFDLAVHESTSSAIRSNLTIHAFYVPFPKTMGKVSDPLNPFTADEEALIARVSAMPLISNDQTYSPVIPDVPINPDPFSP